MKLVVFGFISQDIKQYYCGERQFATNPNNYDLAITKELIRSGRIVIDEQVSVSRLYGLFLDSVPQDYWIKMEIDKAVYGLLEQGVTHLMLGSMMIEQYLDDIMFYGLPVFSISNSVGYVLRGCRTINVGVVSPGTVLYPRSFHQNLLRQGLQVYLPENWGAFNPVSDLIRRKQDDSYPVADTEEALRVDLTSVAEQPISALIYGADNFMSLPDENETATWPDSVRNLPRVNPVYIHLRHIYGLISSCP